MQVHQKDGLGEFSEEGTNYTILWRKWTGQWDKETEEQEETPGKSKHKTLKELGI